jgi:hypothetical protein
VNCFTFVASEPERSERSVAVKEAYLRKGDSMHIKISLDKQNTFTVQKRMLRFIYWKQLRRVLCPHSTILDGKIFLFVVP